jgi:hypothetical protein
VNDTELLTALREALPGIRLETTLEDTVRRGRTLRIRRRARAAAAIAGAAALAGVVADDRQDRARCLDGVPRPR